MAKTETVSKKPTLGARTRGLLSRNSKGAKSKKKTSLPKQRLKLGRNRM